MEPITYNKPQNRRSGSTPVPEPGAKLAVQRRQQATADAGRKRTDHRSASASGPVGKTRAHSSAARAEPVLLKLATLVFALLAVLLLVRGWLNREDSIIVAKEGVGYYLGIIGASMILLLMFYPARKYFKFLRHFGRMRYWFRLHMVLGIVGPLLILFHANFSLGSLNSAVALVSMLVVVVSGIIGRFIYRQVHSRRHDHHYTYAQIRQDLEAQKQVLNRRITLSAPALAIIERFEAYLRRRSGFWSHLLALPVINLKSHEYANSLVRLVRTQVYTSPEYRALSRREKKYLYVKFKGMIERYFFSLRRAANFAVYEKLFSLWHVLHFPLFIVLFFTAVLHVIVVHMY